MNKSGRKTKEELEKIAEKATALSEWLEDKSLTATTYVPMPAEVITVTAVVLMAGSIVLMDGGTVPYGTCWGTCQGST